MQNEWKRLDVHHQRKLNKSHSYNGNCNRTLKNLNLPHFPVHIYTSVQVFEIFIHYEQIKNVEAAITGYLKSLDHLNDTYFPPTGC